MLPVLLVQFGSFGGQSVHYETMLTLCFSFSVILYFVRPVANTRFWNYFIHASLHMGVSIMVFSYAMESYARMVCPKQEGFVNTFIPRIYDCFIVGEGWPKDQ